MAAIIHPYQLLWTIVDIRFIWQLLSSHRNNSDYMHVTSKKQRYILTAKHPLNKFSTQ